MTPLPAPFRFPLQATVASITFRRGDGSSATPPSGDAESARVLPPLPANRRGLAVRRGFPPCRGSGKAPL